LGIPAGAFCPCFWGIAWWDDISGDQFNESEYENKKMSERERGLCKRVLQFIVLLRVDGVTQKRWSDSLHQNQIFEWHHETTLSDCFEIQKVAKFDFEFDLDL
jgi:hypothetical protein